MAHKERFQKVNKICLKALIDNIQAKKTTFT